MRYNVQSARMRKQKQKQKQKDARMKTSDFDYNLPGELIAQKPCEQRDECKLLVMDRASGAVKDRVFKDVIDYVNPGDLLVVNETRVLPARLIGAKRHTGGAAEILLLREVFDREPKTNQSALWEALVKPGKRLKPGSGAIVDFENSAHAVVLSAEVVDWASDSTRGERIVRLTTELHCLAVD